MSDIGPGDIVECIGGIRGSVPREVALAATTGPYPRVGSLYTVRAVGDYYPAGFGRCRGVRLEGIVVCLPHFPDAWFDLDGFRPISRRSDFARTLEQLKRHLVTPAPVKEPAR